MTPNRKCSQTTFTHNYLPFSKLKQLLLSVTELMMNILIFHIHFSYTCLAYKVLNHFLIAAPLSTCLYCLPIYEPFFLLNNTLTNTPILYTLFFPIIPVKFELNLLLFLHLGSWAKKKSATTKIGSAIYSLLQMQLGTSVPFVKSYSCPWSCSSIISISHHSIFALFLSIFLYSKPSFSEDDLTSNILENMEAINHDL